MESITPKLGVSGVSGVSWWWGLGRVIIAVLVPALAVGQSVPEKKLTEGKFRVEKIKPDDVKRLDSAERKLTEAANALAAASAELEKAKKTRDAIANEIKMSFLSVDFTGDCKGSDPISDLGWHGFARYDRPFRTTEIRGEYLLITEGREPCSTSIIDTNGQTPSVLNFTTGTTSIIRE